MFETPKRRSRHEMIGADGTLNRTKCEANSWYDAGLEGFAGGDVAWDTSDIRLILIDEDTDAPNLTTDDFLDDRAAGARVAVSDALASKTFADGILDAADKTFTSVSGDTVESLDVYCHDGGADAARRLLINFDTATGLVLTPDGGNVTVQFDNGANKIARL